MNFSLFSVKEETYNISEEQYGPLPIVRGMGYNNFNSPKDLATPTAENVSRFAFKF